MSDAIRSILAEFDRVAQSGRMIDLWWRDDDAVAATPALDRLLTLSGTVGVPVALAAIPASAEPSLAVRLRCEPDIAVLVHGLVHRNHAQGGGKPAEFGPERSIDALRADVSEGARLASHVFGPRVLPVFVPPWNRIVGTLAACLPDLGFAALSAAGTPGRRVVDGVLRIDTHLDPVEWHASRSLSAPDELVDAVLKAMSADEPLLGLLTHHLMFDEALWDFTAAFLNAARSHPAVRPVSIAKLIGEEHAGSLQKAKAA